MDRRVFLGAVGMAVAGISAAEAKKCPPADPRLKFYIEEDAAGKFRWRLKAGNGDIIATPHQGYSTRAECEDSILRVKRCWGAEIEG